MGSLVSDVRQVARGWRWTRRSLTPRSAEPHTPAKPEQEFPTAWARTPAAQVVRDGIQRFLLGPLVWNQTDPAVFGLDLLNEVRGPVVFVSNHSSHLDAPLILCSLPTRWRERTAVGAAADYFFDARGRAAATAIAFNAFPVDRAGGRRDTSTAQLLLRDGWSLVVFPEGTRSRDGWVGRFRHGAARLCVEEGVPAVPIAIRGAYAAMPRGSGWPRRGRPPISVRYGRPQVPASGEDHRAFSARLRGELARAWDEDATTWWDSLQRAASGATPEPSGPAAPEWRRIWEATKSPPRPGRTRVWSRRR